MDIMRFINATLRTLALCALLAACSDSSNVTAPERVTFEDQPGPLAVGRMTDVTLFDERRDRQVTATYWYPAEGDNAGPGEATEGEDLVAGTGSFPLVVLVHGISDTAPATWPWLAPHLASHGYLVIAPSTGSTLATIGDLVNHPGDVSFLIDSLLEGDVPPGFAARADGERIAVAGYSLGSVTAYSLAHDPVDRDERIKAQILMASLPGRAAPNGALLGFMGIHGTADIAAPYASGLDNYEAANPPRYFVTLQGGGHTGFTSSTEFDIGTTMSQQRHESLSRVTVTAFLASVFAADIATRVSALDYLQRTFNEENLDAEIMYDADHGATE